MHLWKDRKNSIGIFESPLLTPLQDTGFEDAQDADFTWDFKVAPKTVFEYITQVICWRRLCSLQDAGDGFSCVDYWQTHIFGFHVREENWGGETIVGFAGSGRKMYDLLSLRVAAANDGAKDTDSQEYKEAYKLVWRILTRSSMQKITHGKDLTYSVHLGTLWDENPGRDCGVGTFAELLRYGTVHFRQTRESIVKMETVRPKLTIKKGVLEP